MPKRSTPFQNLVHHIQAQLTPNSVVTESVLMKHRLTGEEREVDIVIRSYVGEHPVVVSIECLEKSRPAGTLWVEQMAKKHEHLETNRLVLVSRSGFYRPAQRLADMIGIVAFTPTQACDEDWTQVVGKDALYVFRYDCTPTDRWLRIATPSGEQLVAAGDTTEMLRSNDAQAGTLRDWVHGLLHSPQFRDPMMLQMSDDVVRTATFDAPLAEEVYAVDVANQAQRVVAIRVAARVERTSSRIDLNSMMWKDTPAALAKAETVLGDTILTIVERAPNVLDARITVDGRELHVERGPRR